MNPRIREVSSNNFGVRIELDNGVKIDISTFQEGKIHLSFSGIDHTTEGHMLTAGFTEHHQVKLANYIDIHYIAKEEA